MDSCRPEPADRIARGLFVVSLRVSMAEFADQLAGLGGAELVRLLPPHRVVVRLARSSDQVLLAELPGVSHVLLDRLEHPTRRGPAAPT